MPHSARFASTSRQAASATGRRRARSRVRCRSVVAMQAPWSRPVAEVVVFSNDLARRRERPRRPWAASTRHACRIGRKSGCLSSQPTRRTSRSWCRPSAPEAAAVTSRSTRTNSSRPVTPCVSGAPASAHWHGSRGSRRVRRALQPAGRHVDGHDVRSARNRDTQSLRLGPPPA
jgi:hypothetical protein